MKKFRLFCLVLVGFVLLSCLTPAANATTGQTQDESVTSGCHSIDAAQALSSEGRLAATAKAVIVYERNSSTMVYHWNPDERISPSSMVKIMTAIIALEKGDLQNKVVVTKRALSYWQVGSVSANLVVGEELTLEALLYCMIAASANDAAAVIAEHIGGTQEDFIDMMNQRAAELGCKDTNFTNAHGLDDPNSYTTARDICRIADYALSNDTFRDLFTASSYTIPATNKHEERTIRTTNYMMDEKSKYYDRRIAGGKTGADDSGRCLAAISSGSGMEILTIVMGAQPTYAADGVSLDAFGSFEETASLLDYTYANYTYRQIFYTGQIIAQYPVAGGENNVVVQPVHAQATVLPKDLDESKLSWIYGQSVGTITAPVEQGQVISTLQVWYGSKCLAETQLTAVNAVNIWTEPTQPVRQDRNNVLSVLGIIGLILGILIGLVLLAAAILFGMRMYHTIKRNTLRRNRRMNRHRNQ